MHEKTRTITIDEQGNSTLDLEGFAGQGLVKVERKKPAYHTGQQVQQEQTQR